MNVTQTMTNTAQNTTDGPAGRRCLSPSVMPADPTRACVALSGGPGSLTA